MRTQLAALFNMQGTIDRWRYLLIGIVAFAIKYCLDFSAASLLLHKPWLPWQYLDPVGTTTSFLATGAPERRFLLAMSAIAFPFVWLGVSVTLKRLRSLQAPLSMVLLFFVPMVNLLFFLFLSLIPSRPSGKFRGAVAQGSSHFDALLAIVISVSVSCGAVALAMRFSSYGLGMFLAAPFCLGLISVLVYTWRKPHTRAECIGIAMASCVAVGVGFLIFAFEGAICIAMAAPIAAALAALGATVGYSFQRNNHSPREGAPLLLLLALFPPVMIGSESKLLAPVPEFAVRTSVIIDAPPTRVWHNVISFSQLPEPHELLFRSGIAYPIRADITGAGVGAVRHCVFSTGAFVEPVTVWDEPKLLAFSVTSTPSPMYELSPYADLHPPHLDGFMVSHKGQFLLTPLTGGRTLLEGTTWYEHNLWPSLYWRLWSDMIIHRIHLRVLNHIKNLSEAE
jgi:hypothetical protein